jgi:hypothetical protein
MENKENELNPSDIALKIFSKAPQDPNTIHISIDHHNIILDDVFNILLEIFNTGIKTMFNTNKINLHELTETNLITINQYFNSFGFNFFHEIQWILSIEYIDNLVNGLDENDCDLPTLNKNDNIKEHGDHKEEILKDYFINFISNNVKYKIWFDFI